MFSTFNGLYRFALNVVVFFVGLAITAIIWGVAAFIIPTFTAQIPFIIAGIILGVLAGTYLHVLLLIPLQMSQQFDVLKNKTAQRYYSSVDDFQLDVAKFLIGFFRFPGLNAVGGIFQFNHANKLLFGKVVNENKCLNVSDNTHKTKLDNKHTAHYLPILLSDEKLGHMIIITEGFCMPFFRNILKDFENYMLDDQLLHVISYTKKN